jgi:hypothetical protein
MVVTNRNRKTALAIRRTEQAVLVIIMRSGKLTTSYIKHQDFEKEWREIGDPLERGLDTFVKHAELNGATKAAQNALRKITKEHKNASLRLF